ncbi:hypothetical protein VT84_04560 [Gemmata sp. SH-PL17]|uniref:DUF1571 domain-containing protein n=1 Tax=Gemmata sp. SH-PL17 TaxID=1630693 RepID=UPI0004B2FC85|nr:DUF1571 domain-containing protein [Gemmata sp. SH-PL17]AMV23660.1 hypothetical protein VT84_04560 [Gemmata sp. SH-PL17]
MSRRLIVVIALLAFLIGAGFVGYDRYFSAPPPAVAPVHVGEGELPTQPEFDELAKADPVKMLSACLTRYEREVQGLHCTLEKQERVQGKPKHPEVPDAEVIDLWVRGDVPGAQTKLTAIEVVMKWRAGARRSFGGVEVRGTFFSEKPVPEGSDKKIVTWRPDARAFKLGPSIDPGSSVAQAQSRYCIRDAGLYRSMLRTHEAWKGRQTAGEFKYEYLGTKAVEKADGRECHVIRRICPRTELDAFELGGTASTDPKIVAAEGFTEVVIYIDRERWLQVGTEQYRTEPDGTRVTLGTYFFRDVVLNPTFASDTFTTDGLKK